MDLKFNQRFGNTHYRKGQETFAVPRLWKGLEEIGVPITDFSHPVLDKDSDYYRENFDDIRPMFMTLRKNNIAFYEGVKFMPRIWSDGFLTPTVNLAKQEVTIVKTYPYYIYKQWPFINGKELPESLEDQFLADVGCDSMKDLLDVIRYIKGTVICWKEIDYIT